MLVYHLFIKSMQLLLEATDLVLLLLDLPLEGDQVGFIIFVLLLGFEDLVLKIYQCLGCYYIFVLEMQHFFLHVQLCLVEFFVDLHDLIDDYDLALLKLHETHPVLVIILLEDQLLDLSNFYHHLRFLDL
jgi:hypothetical protein